MRPFAQLSFVRLLAGWLTLAILLAAPFLGGCSSTIPEGRSAIDSVRIVNASALDGRDVRDKLATTESPKFLGLFRGLFYDYEIFDASMLQRDLARVERYYRGHGFLEAHARAGRVIHTTDGNHVRVEIVVDEGAPTVDGNVRVDGLDDVPAPVASEVRSAATGALSHGTRFDEDAYAKAKVTVARALTDRGYAYATVKAAAQADLVAHTIDYVFTIHAGPKAVFGPITLIQEADGDKTSTPVKLDEALLRRTLNITAGDSYSTAAIDAATQALLDLEVLSSVQIIPTLPDPPASVVPLTVKLQAGKMHSIRVGGGLEFDEIKTELHGLVSWEDHDFFGNLRDFTVEFKPGVVLYPMRVNNIVVPTNPLPEERLRLQLKQPAFLEPRTTLLVQPEGNVFPMLVAPNPPASEPVLGFGELKGAIGLERRFGKHFLVRVVQNVQSEFPFAYTSLKLEQPTPPIVLSYPQLVTTLDFRDDPIHTHSGFYLSNDLTVAGGPFGGSASDVRVQPEARGYIPIARGVTFATRGSVGLLFASNYGDYVQNNLSKTLDPNPTSKNGLYQAVDRDIEIVYFRGFFSGGPSSNRGYPLRGIAPYGLVPFLSPATLQAQQQVAASKGGGISCIPGQPNYSAADCLIPIGGFTLWEASAEVRFDLSGPLGAATFCDAGDVAARQAEIRLNHVHLSCGAGARYDTPVGAIRLDVAYRVQPLQVIGYPNEVKAAQADPTNGLPPTLFGWNNVPVALSFGIGESFQGMAAVRAAAKTLGTGLVFVVAVAAGLVAHMDVPAVRRAIVARVNVVLASALAGHIVIERVGSVGPSGVEDVDARVEDPDGKTVLHAWGLSARLSTWDLLRSLVSGPDVRVRIEELTVARTDVSIDADDKGALGLVRAFTPPPPTSPSTGGGGGGVRLSLPHALLAHVAVHGRPPAGPLVDGYVDGMDASVSVTPTKIVLQVSHALIAERDLSDHLTTSGVLDARFEQPAADGSDRFVWASWRGLVGALAGTADAIYDAGKVDAVVDIPLTRPECVRDLWAACPFGEDVAAHVEVHGALPELLVTARASVGKGSVSVFGQASVGDEVRASLRIAATSVDARALTPSAPSTDLAMSGDVMLVSTAAGPAGGVAAFDFAGGTVATTRVPSASGHGQLERDAAGALSAQASVAVHEPGAPATVVLRLVPSGSSFQIGFDASAEVPRLDGMPRVGPVARGSAKARAHGTIDLARASVDAGVDASVVGIAAGGVRLRAATLEAHASGAIVSPSIEATLVGSGLEAGPLRFDGLRARVHGTPARADARVSMHGHGADLVARATVGLAGGTTLRDVDVTVDRNGETARATATIVRFAPHETSVDDLEVEGLGAPLHATVRFSPGALTAKARSQGLDLVRLGNLAGVSGLGGRVSLDVDASIRAASAQGRISLDLSQGSYAGWKDAQAHVDATLDGLRAAGRVTASVGGIGTVDASSSSLEIGAAGPLEASAWRTAWGEIDLAAHVDLAKLSAQLPKGTIPMGRLSGTVDVKGRVERDSASDTTPDVDVTASTSGLALTGTPIPWRIDGIGATVHTHVDGRTGATAVDAQIADTAGALVALQASSTAVPYARMFTADEPLEAALLAMPFHATVTLPSHDVTKLPAFLGTRGMEGMLEAAVEWQGAADRPTVDVRAMLTHGHAESNVLALPVDIAVTGHYDGAHADVSALANAHGREVLAAGASVDVRMADLLGEGELPWKASAHGKLTDFPLQSVAALDDRQVRGTANGTFQLDELHENARASVAVTLTDLQVGEVACRPTTLDVTADGHAIDGSARIVEQDGYAEAKAHFGTHWGKAIAPSVDPSQATDVLVTAKNFRAAVLLPFVSQLFTELDGRIDGSAHILVDPVARTMKPEGTITLSGGVFELSAMGSELHDASARVTFTPDGLVRLDHASARGLTGRVQVAATARLQGLALVSAHAVVQVPQKEPLPLVVDGTQVGMVDGRMDVVLARAADALDVKVDVPTLRVQLPDSSTHSVQTLDQLADVEVGIGHRGGPFVPLVLDAGDAEVAPSVGPRTPTRLTAHLGDVEVRRGSDLDVHMDGTPVVTIAETVTAKGQIRLSRGTLNVQGKTFKIDDGSTVTFIDDPTNPQVVLTASWVAPSSDPSSSGTTVFAEFVGPLRTGKVTLRSEPQLARTEILSLLLYGTTDQQGGSGGAGSQQVNAAGGVAGGAASANINRALGGVNNALDSVGLATEVSTKIDTSQPTPRPEVEVQIARDLSLQVAVVLGVPPPGNNPDSTLLTVAYSFLRHWRAETTVGNAGTTILDLVWERRY